MARMEVGSVRWILEGNQARQEKDWAKVEKK